MVGGFEYHFSWTGHTYKYRQCAGHSAQALIHYWAMGHKVPLCIPKYFPPVLEQLSMLVFTGVSNTFGRYVKQSPCQEYYGLISMLACPMGVHSACLLKHVCGLSSRSRSHPWMGGAMLLLQNMAKRSIVDTLSYMEGNVGPDAPQSVPSAHISETVWNVCLC